MGKYDAPLDMDSRNSLMLILDRVRRGSSVLEFGPANGRMTKYLRENKDCHVDIVEIDETSGKDAAVYADISCIGSNEGDIEKYLWAQRLVGRQYDVILFADVLEHLRYPARVLSISRRFLKKRGHIITSIPNIANNALLIGLWNHRFNYTDTGLLDDTHIRFFTYDSFLEMIRKVGLCVCYAGGTVAPVETTELSVSYEMVPEAVQQAMKARDKGDIYQYVFDMQVAASEMREPIIADLPRLSYYYASCYFKGRDEADFKEEKRVKIIQDAYPGEIKRIEIPFLGNDDVGSLRISPLNVPCMLENVAVYAVYKDDEVRSVSLQGCRSNGIQQDDFWFFLEGSSEIVINLPSYTNKIHKIVLQYAIKMMQNVDLIRAISQHFADMKKDLNNAEQKVEEYQEQLQQCQSQLQQYRSRLQQLEKGPCQRLRGFFRKKGNKER